MFIFKHPVEHCSNNFLSCISQKSLRYFHDFFVFYDLFNSFRKSQQMTVLIDNVGCFCYVSEECSVNWMILDQTKINYVRHTWVEVLGEMEERWCCKVRNADIYRWFSVYDQCLKTCFIKKNVGCYLVSYTLQGVRSGVLLYSVTAWVFRVLVVCKQAFVK